MPQLPQPLRWDHNAHYHRWLLHQCIGVRRQPPFSAHAWLQVDGTPVREMGDRSTYVSLVTLPPLHLRSTRRSTNG